MKRLFCFVSTLSALSLVTACATPRAGASRSSSQPGHGAVSMQIVPNPIVATPVSGSTYDFPFDVVVRETGGHPLTVRQIVLDVFAFGGLKVASESYDAARISALGYPTTIPANGDLRYHLAPRKEVSDDRLFGSVTGQVRIEATDDSGAPTNASTTVTVTR